MIAYQSRDLGHTIEIKSSRGDYIKSNNLQELLNFLLTPHYPIEFLVVWNLEQFIAPILKRVSLEYLQKLCDKGQSWIKESGHSITYNPKKSIHLTLGSNRANYYQLSQFFNGDKPENLQDLEAKGSNLLQELGSIGIEPWELSSPVTIIGDLLREVKYPDSRDIPDEVGQIAWDCCGRPWVEAHKLGCFNKAFDLDIVSSFPSACAELLDLRYGKWVESNTIPEGAYYGFARGRVSIWGKVSPIVYINGSGKLFNPMGKWDTTLTLQEIKFIEEYGIGNFKIESGWWWIAKEVKINPFREIIERLYKCRQKSELLNLVTKKSMVALYGKFLQTYDNGERLDLRFNPVYGAMVETPIRLKVAGFILNNHLEDNVIHISTDGCLLDKRVGLKDKGEMGEWRLDSSGPALVVSSGCLFYGNKRPNQITYPKAMEMVEGKPGANNWGKESKRIFTVGDVLDSGDLEKIGQEMPIVIGFGLKAQHDRIFTELPDTGVQLLEKHYRSQPIKVSELSKPMSKID